MFELAQDGNNLANISLMLASLKSIAMTPTTVSLGEWVLVSLKVTNTLKKYEYYSEAPLCGIPRYINNFHININGALQVSRKIADEAIW